MIALPLWRIETGVREMAIRKTLLACGAAVAALAMSQAQAQTAPDMIIYDAHIVTVDGKFSIAQAASVAESQQATWLLPVGQKVFVPLEAAPA